MSRGASVSWIQVIHENIWDLCDSLEKHYFMLFCNTVPLLAGNGGHAITLGVLRELDPHEEGYSATPLLQLPGLQRQQTSCLCEGTS